MGSNSGRWLLLAATAGLCLAQTPASLSPDAAATVVTLGGNVSVLLDSVPWALQTGDHIRPGQFIVTGPDGYALFKVADGSTFEVFPNSRVTFRDNAGNWKDLLDLLLGRIKVHIQKWGGQPNPNRVHTPTAIISVRGTVFDITVEDSDTTLVLVEEGQVEVEHRLLPSGSKLLNPGEWLRVYKNERLSQKTLDKGSILQTALRTAADAIYSTIYRSPRAPGGGVPTPGGGGTGGGLPGDHGQTNPTPPPAPPPPSGDTGGPPPPPAPPK
jgi:ferric-dicitrate binding protein FerR (iron transport regulator)